MRTIQAPVAPAYGQQAAGFQQPQDYAQLQQGMVMQPQQQQGPNMQEGGALEMTRR